jgi:hypothetical protein
MQDNFKASQSPPIDESLLSVYPPPRKLKLKPGHGLKYWLPRLFMIPFITIAVYAPFHAVN